ncbi:hypothetical protein OROMI_034855 [Orobanche minor]
MLQVSERHGTVVVAMFLKSGILIRSDSRVTKDLNEAIVIQKDDTEKIKIFPREILATYVGDVGL